MEGDATVCYTDGLCRAGGTGLRVSGPRIKIIKALGSQVEGNAIETRVEELLKKTSCVQEFIFY